MKFPTYLFDRLINVFFKCLLLTEKTFIPLLIITLTTPDLPPFDEALVWTLSKDLFDEDIVRWRIAWNGLIEVGWVRVCVRIYVYVCIG